ncbi:MAG TPA: aminotransferase class III-fold pyridoxal phosphate-dependent enzyme [Gemmatimonadaceae bacterium]|nr:aminotransferase class III-fold pyridoxal phosphate-dependent enzyme [Gemmatimonadaceae bacterium]
MPLRRFFGRGEKPAAEEAPNAAEEVEATEQEPDVDEENVDYDAPVVDTSWRERAELVIPGGTSTGSKRADALWGEGAADLPTHYVSARGCRIVTADEQTLIDCTMGLGSVALGYGDEQVLQIALNAAALGNVAGLAHVTEVELAERLCETVPCAEQVRFFKTGAEAVSAAVRVARAATGRSKIVCSGYFGWHDWANSGRGIPAGAKADVLRVPFDDVTALEVACDQAGSDLAAVVLEPVVEKLPSEQWTTAARAQCTERGAILVFDEIKTGFRLRTAGYQEYSGVQPDLATFGKALANGFPIAALVGRAGPMEVATETWISSTLAGESIALGAALAVVDRFERDNVSKTLWSTGEAMMRAARAAIRSSGVPGVQVQGIAPMWFLAFDDPAVERFFLARAAHHGVLFKRGAYNFPALAHDEKTLDAIEAAASSALVDVAEELRSGSLA